MTTTPIRFSIKPSRAISRTVNRCEPKMIALGPVATGSMNAKLALIAAGIIIKRGSISAPIAAAARMGISNVVVAVLLVTSVRKVTARQMTPIMTIIGSTPSRESCSPSRPLSPDCVNAGDADAAGKQNQNSPGNSFGGFPIQKFFAFSIGNQEHRHNTEHATLASLALWGMPRSAMIPLQPSKGCFRVIHRPAVTANTVNVRISSICQANFGKLDRFDLGKSAG